MNRSQNKRNDKLVTNDDGDDDIDSSGHNMTCNKSLRHDLPKTGSYNTKVMVNTIVLIIFFILLLLSLIPVTTSAIGDLPLSQPDYHRSGQSGDQSLTLCQKCRVLTESFDAGLERTKRGKFEGGDTNWEESKLRSYSNSEIRLTEIQEMLCNELSSGKDQCHHLAEEYEPQIENWWFTKRQSGETLYDYLCMNKMKACCPDNHYGPNCTPCPGYPYKVCNNRGYCSGNGSTDGTGKCLCDAGFTGNLCNMCAKNYFKNDTTEDGLPICQECHKSCQDGCRSSGPKGCLVCGTGYIWDNDYGCLDVDECVDLGVTPCETNAFCINTEGSYYCYQCDKACDGCNGDGPDSCLKCAPNYVLNNDICIDVNSNKREVHISLARYATYLGLCVATCIIFRNNIYVASVIGVVVGVYITISEFTLKDDIFNPLANWGFNM
ncbi:cysteine-rich with EGF-like domain protein 2 [Oppia nitens]|uniref:cysteine-rich with EGF-like domain protein 2 n=1 Tax=Oppia nitens TaxID=1686743 RepID=UPI0023DA82CD|nr:cysteine-rich with EGF-like domain protein 2 [Oppia nitens]